MNRRGFLGRLAGFAAGAAFLRQKAPPFPVVPDPPLLAPPAGPDLDLRALPHLDPLTSITTTRGSFAVTSCTSYDESYASYARRARLQEVDPSYRPFQRRRSRRPR